MLLLENVRFHPEDEANDPEFAHQLASLGEIFVNDAFAASHRAHASVVGVAQYLPAYAGRADGGRARRAAPGARRSQAAAGRGRRRRQGLDQGRRPAQPAREGRRAAHRWRDGQHVLQGAGLADRAAASSKTRRWRTRERGREDGGPASSCCPVDLVCARRDGGGAAAARRSPPTRSSRAGWRWTSARKSVALFAEQHRAARAPSSGTGRWASPRSPDFSDGTKAVGEAIAALGRIHAGRRRRHGGRRSTRWAWPVGSRTSRPEAARPSSTSRARSCPASPILKEA